MLNGHDALAGGAVGRKRVRSHVKIMVVGAHAADCEIMAGAVVAKHTATGGEAVLVHMTLGERGHPSLPSEQYARQKQDEAQEAAARLRTRARFLPYRDGELTAGM